MKVINQFLDPILKTALEKKRLRTVAKPDIDAEAPSLTLLDHLVQYTDGERFHRCSWVFD